MAHCPICGPLGGEEYDPRLVDFGREVQPAVVRVIQARHAGWNPSQGICPSCLLRFVAELQDERSPVSLQPATTPPGSFPYYHAAEETVLPQAIRLPVHDGMDGTGVTVAFLDSGYYPHPDLTALREWPEAPEWSQLDPAQLREFISAQPLRIAHYVDLTDNQQLEGLDAGTLWDGGGDSWHGQMTSVIALGNGLLSGGLYRGYAPGASGLLIKIGRGGGRIPEEDILRGLKWLLEDDRWERYGVRVLNVSVGGDFEEPWHVNAACLAAEELSRQGLFIVAAAGNRGHDQLVAPAQSPSVLTVGGIDDFNRRWSPIELDEIARLDLYHHNWHAHNGAEVSMDHTMINKPEVLALARWLPSPILPPNPLLGEMVAIEELRQRLLTMEESPEPSRSGLRSLLSRLPTARKRHAAAKHTPVRRAELSQMLRQRMNEHKWIHPYYQHVDGSSIAAAQVSAVAAQMIQANPTLTPAQVKALILETALPLPHHPAERTGAGVIQPTRAVAAAMRVEGGPLVGLPISGTQPDVWSAAPALGSGTTYAYVGLWAPQARAVSVVGDFNNWQPGAWPLNCMREGWWHATLALPPGRHGYRFWVEWSDPAVATWLPDPENPARIESGYTSDHSLLIMPA